MANFQTYVFPSIFRGDTLRSRTLTVVIDAAPASILSARMMFRDVNGTLVATMTCSVLGNVVTLTGFSNALTELFPVGRLYHDLELTLVGGRVITWMKGYIEIREDVSHG